MAAREMERLEGNTWILPGAVNLGLYEREGRVWGVDSGGDDSSGRRVLRALEGEGWTLEGILCTHSHADHIGGNAFLQRRTGCRVAAPRGEAALVERPDLEPFTLWGAFPPKALRTKFLQASPSRVTDPFDPGDLVGGCLRALDLKGHMVAMAGAVTPDGVAFVGDSVLGEEILAKHGVPFFVDYPQALKTLDRLEALEARLFVPSHGEPVRDVRPLAEANRRVLSSLREEVRDLCRLRTRDGIVGALTAARGRKNDLVAEVLHRASVSALLSDLLDAGEVQVQEAPEGLVYQRV